MCFKRPSSKPGAPLFPDSAPFQRYKPASYVRTRTVRFNKFKAVAEFHEEDEWRECWPKSPKPTVHQLAEELEELNITEEDEETSDRVFLNTRANKRRGERDEMYERPAPHYESVVIDSSGDLDALCPHNPDAFYDIDVISEMRDLDRVAVGEVATGKGTLVTPPAVEQWYSVAAIIEELKVAKPYQPPVFGTAAFTKGAHISWLPSPRPTTSATPAYTSTATSSSDSEVSVGMSTLVNGKEYNVHALPETVVNNPQNMMMAGSFIASLRERNPDAPMDTTL
ncbi:hypothetical protein BC835DRAFT_1414448 [Cytidiella melzeri]|nr:hypothetical protein BC835DRAFT_1414448 [Cytidiella melzeri]